MKALELTNYNLAELKGLLHDVGQEIKSRQNAEIQKAREQILAIAQSAGVSIEELLSTAPLKQKKEGKKVLPQFANPADRSLTWTGRGRQPKWVVEALTGGKTLDDLRM